jgi:hypothetical protein
MKFQPKSADDIKRESLIEPGEYDFEVLSAEDKVSKSGNEMIAVKLAVYVDGKARHAKDWLMEKMAFKLRHFCEATGLLAKYEAGDFTAADCQGRAGKVRIVIQDNPEFGPQNVVKDYVVAKQLETAMTPVVKPMSAAEKAHEDSIPF